MSPVGELLPYSANSCGMMVFSSTPLHGRHMQPSGALVETCNQIKEMFQLQKSDNFNDHKKFQHVNISANKQKTWIRLSLCNSDRIENRAVKILLFET